MVSCTYNGDTTTYTYGYDGLRRSSTKDSVTTNYVYDGTNLVAEMRPNASGNLVTTTTYLLGMQGVEAKIDETAQTEAYYEVDANDNRVTDPTTGNGIIAYRGVTAWYIYDGHGNVVGTVNQTGAYTANPPLDVYGIPRATGAAATKQGYCGSLGHVTDDTGLVYMRARYYDPSVGRFTSEDPGANGNNWYVYCKDNPVNMTDQDGKEPNVYWGNYWFDVGAGLFLLSVLTAVGGRLYPTMAVAAYSTSTNLALAAGFAFTYSMNEMDAQRANANNFNDIAIAAFAISLIIQQVGEACAAASGLAGGCAVVAIIALGLEAVQAQAVISSIGSDA
jgi:RHS repeat-associated protein